MRRRPDVTRAAQLNRFLAWLMGKATQGEMGTSARTFRRNHHWCWNVEPQFTVTGEVFDEVQLDGTYLRGAGLGLLTAINGAGEVLNRQWCNRESTAGWKALIAPLPPPRVVVCDGGTGLAAALGEYWPATRIQRCLVHAQRGVFEQTTQAPRTDAGKGLKQLGLTLTRVKTLEQANAWVVRLNDWHQQFAHLLTEKTYLDTPGVLRPAFASRNAKWWYTHYRLRRAYRLLDRLYKAGHLFTYLDPELAGLGISSTTNRIEGGTNGSLKWVLRHHRGMPTKHRVRALEWWCHLHSPSPKPPASFIKPEHWQPTEQAVETSQAHPAGIGTAIGGPTGKRTTTEPIGDPDAKPDYETGISIRKGWAGRPK